MSLKLNYALQNTCCYMYVYLSFLLSACPSVRPYLSHVHFFRIIMPFVKGNNRYIQSNKKTSTTSPPEPISKFQPHLAQNTLGLRGLSFFQMKDLALFLRVDNINKLKLMDNFLKIFSNFNQT